VNDTQKPAVEEQLAPPALLKVINPLFRRILTSPLHAPMSKGLMVLHITGRKTGNLYHVPVGRHELDGQLLTYGGGAWRNNLRGGADLRVTLDGRERSGHAVLDEDPERVAQVFTKLLDRLGYKKASRLGLKVNVDRPPTPDEIREATRGRTLVLITLTE
jgi:hypothetical protein